jgi:hypothetical protein
MTTPLYGFSDNSFKAAGEEAGIRKLVDDFYRFMEPTRVTSLRYFYVVGWVGQNFIMKNMAALISRAITLTW